MTDGERLIVWYLLAPVGLCALLALAALTAAFIRRGNRGE